MCVCVCMCVWLSSSRSFKHVSLNNKQFFSVSSIQDPFKFSDECLSFSLEFVDEFHKIVPSSFGPFHKASSGVTCLCKVCLYFF